MSSATGRTLMTAEEFYEWCQRPENAGRRVELVKGDIVEMPPTGSPHGGGCAWIVHLLYLYAAERGLGRVYCNDAGLVVGRGPDTVRGPDIMFYDEAITQDQAEPGPRTDPPRLIVEVKSPSDRPNRILARVTQYLQMGVPLIWVVDPEDHSVGVHRPGELPIVADDGETLDGGEALPGLKIPVSKLWNWGGKQ